MTTIRTTPAGLATELRKLAAESPKALERGMVEGALMLKGALVQREIAHSEPQPVDRGQYKAGWTMTEIEGGAAVGNTTKQALWVERGRGPGPVSFKAILEWVRRKGFVRAKTKAAAKAANRRSSKNEIEQAEEQAARAITAVIAYRGIPGRWVLLRALTALKGKMLGILKRALAEVGR